MKFYIDVEAQRFSNYIISIGISASNGNTFYSLVKPFGKKKIDNFITELTGITNEMLAEAPSADEVFLEIANFIENNHEGTPKYYVYGDSDKTFFEATLAKMENPRAIMCAQAITGNLIDYATTVKHFFMASSDLALRKVYMLIQAKDGFVQQHNALEDAKMLQVVAENLEKTCKPTDKDTIMAMPSQAKPKIKKVPAIFSSWDGIPKWKANTKADENLWMIKAKDQHSNDIKYFDSVETAVLWVIRYVARNVSPKSEEHKKGIRNKIMNATKSGSCKYNCYWEYNAEGAIASALNKGEEENDG